MLRKVLVPVCLLLLVAVSGAQGIQPTPDSSALIEQVMQRLGLHATTRSLAELVIQEGPIEQRFRAEVWSLPHGMRRVELIAPESVKGTAAAVKDGQAYLIAQNERGRRAFNLDSVVSLFTLADDILGPAIFEQPWWDDAKVVVGDPFLGRATWELQALDELGQAVHLIVDQKTAVPLALLAEDGNALAPLVAAHEVVVGESDGDITAVTLSMGDNGFSAIVQLQQQGSLMVPRQVVVDLLGLTLTLTMLEVAPAQLPPELAIPSDLFPQDDPRFAEAGHITAAGDYEAAAHLLEALTRDNPYHVPGHVQLGYVYLQLGDWMGARSSFEQALFLDPSNLLAANNLAYVYIVSGTDIERGVALAATVVEMHPTVSAYLDTLGWGLYQLGRYEEALVVLESAVNNGRQQLRLEDSAEVVYHYARALQSVGRLAEARKIAQEALGANPGHEQLLELMRELGPM